jgi:4-hydroxybenzoate polyprenyltransferase
MPEVVVPPSPAGGINAWLRAAHIGPTIAVTALAGLLAVDWGLPTATAALVTAAVLTGQLTIGWGNDLVDAERDRRVGRRDKPLALGVLDARRVTGALLLALAASVALSGLLGWRSALAHVVLVIGAGHAYNIGLKATAWSWLPYAVAFGSLPGVVTLAQATPALPAPWMVAAGAMLGVGAHFLNALPDLDDDEAAGVRGLPHRLGPDRSRWIAVGLLVVASAVVIAAWSTKAAWWGVVPNGAFVMVLAAIALRGKGNLPFQAAVIIAVLDVAMLGLAGS